MFEFSIKIEKVKELTSQLEEYHIEYDKFKKSVENKDNYEIQIYNYDDGYFSLPDELDRELTKIIELRLLERISKLEGEIEARLK
jgi:hypothetical protein